MILIYLETPLGGPVNYALDTLQDIIPASTMTSSDCPVVHLPSDHGEIWMYVDQSKNPYGVVVLYGASEFVIEWEYVI